MIKYILLVLAICTALIYWLLQRVSPGEIILNTDRPTYSPGESVVISISTFDHAGHTLCNSNLSLEITGPDKVQTDLSITSSPTCGDDNVTNDPDYFSSFTPQVSGQYHLKLTSHDSGKTIKASIEVKDQFQLAIKRSSAVRLDRTRPNRYPMIITITANQDYHGIVEEQLPKSIEIIWYGSAVVNQALTHQSLTWQIDLKQGESIDLKYEYMAPQTESELFTLGPIKTKDQTISSYWQVL